MKKLIFITVICALLSGTVLADFDSGKSVVTRTDGYYVHGFGGGEFTISTATLSTNAYSTYTKNQVAATDYNQGGVYEDMTHTFHTFCLETNEYVNLPHMVEQTIVNWDGTDSFAVNGGKDPSPDPDPIDPKTAYLYTMFATGALANLAVTTETYDYIGVGRVSDAQQLQNAIWCIEQEIGGLTGKALTWYNEAENAVDIGSWVGIGNVRALNLWDNSETKPLQDQLYLVPVPGAVLLGILGFGVVGLKLRKFA